MNFRLQQFLAAENITQAQFADEIGVARASVSHIIAGRNKPGFDFIQNMSRRYPDLNLEWLIQGKGRMYKEDRADRPRVSEVPEGQLFAPDTPSFETAASPRVPRVNPPAVTQTPKTDPTADSRPAPLVQPDGPRSATGLDSKVKNIDNKVDYTTTPKVEQQIKERRIVRFVVFYDDNTYQELREA